LHNGKGKDVSSFSLEHISAVSELEFEMNEDSEDSWYV